MCNQRFKDKWRLHRLHEDWLFPLDREALCGTKVIKLKWRRLRSLPLSYVVRTVLRHPAIVSRRWPLGGNASFLDRIPKLLYSTRDEHVEPRDHSDPCDRRTLGDLFVACGRGSMVWSHKGRSLAIAKFACRKRRLLSIATVQLRYSSESYFFLFNTLSLIKFWRINSYNKLRAFYILWNKELEESEEWTIYILFIISSFIVFSW